VSPTRVRLLSARASDEKIKIRFNAAIQAICQALVGLGQPSRMRRIHHPMNWGRLDVDLLHAESIYPIEPVKCRSDQFSRPVGVDVSTAPHTDSTLLTPPRLSSPTDMLYHLVSTPSIQVGKVSSGTGHSFSSHKPGPLSDSHLSAPVYPELASDSSG
jgi:hypothetical protein